ncbi:hypothetical protein P5G65_24195 [Paenibacillus chondroitinus]|uniref:Uncharacterized protein n=1 Tax=Paenibacillus chondroitinus TaxID=59842 RepID=A0ABU6DGX0_9BACL|nr:MULTISPECIES: hypothetical protein [Paenibacillus]MCY9659610.1 hypothetical protein [Paenibacillus anseongense]MEB4797006.1 hypothetical protein [Paenibacillus chondroitinus]
MMKFKSSELSKIIGFHRKHQRVPSLEQVDAAFNDAIAGDIDGALRLLDWKRHCFYVKDNFEREVMSKVFAYCSEVIE